ncbi:MAG: hypothetical protein JSW55_13020 [Chloroflexota bacterium]|nr:MAG: hypothetical protein JSW55_13020 [Chloroflexota bacterium]
MRLLIRRTTLTILLLLLTMTLAACGTLDVALEPGVTPTLDPVQAEATSTPEPAATTEQEPTPTLIPPTPMPTSEPTLELPPTAGPTPKESEPSSLWATYRDEERGLGYAYPCFWLNQGSTISSYDGDFALEHTIRGHWIDSQPPDGVVKIDIGEFDYADYGIDDDVPLGEAITMAAGDLHGDGRAAFESIEETTIAGRTVQRVHLGELPDSWGGDPQRESYYFPIEPGRWFRVFVLPTEMIHSSSVQGLLESLALSADETITIPAFDPDAPVEGRELYLSKEAGYCFQYPSEFELEEYGTGSDVTAGQTVSLKLERPLYTVGLTARARMVGLPSTLEEGVDNFLLGFSEEAAAGIRRNPAEVVGGVDFRLGDEPAEALDGVPGPVKTLDIFAMHGDMLYQLTYSPSPFDNPQAGGDIWALNNVVQPSFSFLP